jgi:hypothetical protein
VLDRRAHAPVNDELSDNQRWESDKKLYMRFNIAKKSELTITLQLAAKGGEQEEWQPGEQREEQHAAG